MRVNIDNMSDSDQSDCEVEEEVERIAKLDLGYTKHTKYRDGVLTIGCVGKAIVTYLLYISVCL